MFRAFQGKTDQIDNDIGTQVANLFSKSSGALFGRAVHLDGFHAAPSGVTAVRGPNAPADVQYFVTGSDQSWDEVCPDMSGSTDDNGTHMARIFGRARSWSSRCPI